VEDGDDDEKIDAEDKVDNDAGQANVFCSQHDEIVTRIVCMSAAQAFIACDRNETGKEAGVYLRL
jgi:hypothetical protein